MVEPARQQDSEVSLLALWDVVRRQYWIVATICTLALLSSVIVALVLPPIYRSDVVAAPVSLSESRGLFDQFSGLASIAGVRLPKGGDSATNIAILRSRAFAISFIEDRDLMPVLFADEWNSEEKQWIEPNPDDHPSLIDAVKYFHEEVLFVQEDPATGIVTVAIEWRDPSQAATWANDLIERLNEETRKRALDEVNRNLEYLRAQLNETRIVELKLALSRLIEAELKKAMYAMGSNEYAFNVLDPGMVPTERVRPRRTLIVILSGFLGGLVAIILALVRDNIQRQLLFRRSVSGETIE